MFKQIHLCLLSIFFCLSFKTVVSQSFTVTNPPNISRKDEIVAIPTTHIADSIKMHGIEKVCIRLQKQKQYLLSLLVDTGLDKDYDEILFQTPIGPNRTLTFIAETL